MALYHFSAKVLSRSGRNTVRALAYRAGCKLYDERTGETFNYQNKPVQQVELVLPKDAPEWAKSIQALMKVDRRQGVQAFSDMVERAEKRGDAQVYREFEFALHRELTEEQNMALAREFVENEIAFHGMTAQMNFHFDVDSETGEEKPHCHVTATMRYLEENGLSSKKERAWNSKEYLCGLRVKWEEYSNFHLKLNGHDIQIDHRSNIERGIEMEPQPKLSQGVREQEKRLQQLEGGDGSPITDRARIFHEAQLRNLYRIVRNPDVVLDIVTKHHATFMWADVQKVLHRYVDEAPLFQRVEAKLKNSSELLLLRSDEKSGNIYTTHTMLKAEKALIETAEHLNQVKSHGVEADHIEHYIGKANKALEDKGGISDDQVKAIQHLVDEGPIKCVVGIAGAGKTTALGVCHEIWKAEGYNVYGLAPTGKAAQNLEAKNLEQNGIESTTLHKFLKSYGEGRCQYNENTVLVLDEAGMVDVERFGKLLGAVQQLGVKLIVVGDGAQLQPVEAGPAFRLVTERLGRTELNTVVRQKEDWQKEATILFGQQKTAEAIQAYADKGCVHIVEEKLPSFDNPENYVKGYEIAHRVSSLMYREMAREVSREDPDSSNHYSLIRNHQDFDSYAYWKGIERKAARSIFENAEAARPVLEERCIDPLNIALVLSDKFQPKEVQQEEARERLKECKLDYLIGIQKPAGTGVDVREQAKVELIQSWHGGFQETPAKASIMLAYSNPDVNDLNRSARSVLKESGHLSKEEFTYTVKKMVEDDFGRKSTLQEEKPFSQGDRIVFTRNNYELGVKNGSMGIITDLDNQKIQVMLDEKKNISFAPKLNPHFDQGWAVTIHKSQGTTVDKTYVLASYEMTQNLAYVAMTRHREDVKVFGSSLDFWRSEKLPEVLSKSGEKLGPADYLDGDSLNKLMEKEDTLLTKIFERVSNELEAMGAVAKKAFWQAEDHFLGNNSLGTHREKETRIIQPGTREEVRAGELLKKDSAHEAKGPPPVPDARKVWENLTKTCEKYLYGYMARDNVPFTFEKRERIPLQAERAANFIFYAHALRGTELSEQETRPYLLRAKYELDRLPQIKEKLREDWYKRGIFDEEKDPLLIHMIAERRASIEGRLYLESKQAGLKPSSNIPQLAEAEFKAHRAQTKFLAQKLSSHCSLSEEAAKECARNIFRYQEIHGAKPTDTQRIAMAEIAHQLEDKYNTPFEREVDSHNLAYMRRRDGDSLFRERCYEAKSFIEQERDLIKLQEKTLFETQNKRIEQEVSRQKERDFSMSM